MVTGSKMGSFTCAQCGVQNSEAAKFCGQCGAVTPPAAAPQAPPKVDARLAAQTLVEFSMPEGAAAARIAFDPTVADIPAFVPQPQPVAAAPAAPAPPPQAPRPADPRAFAKTMMQYPSEASPPSSQMAPPSAHVPPPAPHAAPHSVHVAPKLSSAKQTMIGVAVSDLVPARALAEAQAAPVPVHAQRAGVGATMLGVAMPGIAPISPGQGADDVKLSMRGAAGTMLGVALPGIAPLHAGVAQRAHAPQPQQQSMQRTAQMRAVTIEPMPAPLVEEALPSAPTKRAKGGLPIAAVAGGIAALLAIGGIAIAFLWKSAPPILVAPRLDAQGHELLHLTCETCKDGTIAELDGLKATFATREADLLLKSPLKVGDNPFALSINRPGIDRDETAKVIVHVPYRVRPDLTTVSAKPPTITIRVEALPGTDVRLDDKPVTLDANGQGSHAVNISAETEGPSDDIKPIERKFAYAITAKGQPTEKGQVSARVRVTPLHLDAPGSHAVIEGTTFVVAGQTTPGATVTVNGQPAALDATGAFARPMDAAQMGDMPIEVQASATGAAPRVVHFTLKRVEHLETEAKAAEASATLLGYDAIAADLAGKIGQRAVVEGEVVEARITGHQTILLLSDRRGCTAKGEGACLARVVHGAKDDGTPAAPTWRGQPLNAKRGDLVRVYGHVARAVTTAAGKSVPEIEADFVLRGSPLLPVFK